MDEDEREAKLPKWVRDSLTQLRREVSRLNETMVAINSGVKNPVGYVTTLNYTRQIPILDETSHVRWYLNGTLEEDDPTQWVDLRLQDGKLQVTGGSSFVIEPRVSNQVRISILD